jgi:hypothetical protein
MMGYIVSKSIELKEERSNYLKERNCGMTEYVKLCTNYVEDWQDTLNNFNSVGYMGYDPFWYGMVAWVSPPVTVQNDYDKKFYVNNLKILDGQSLWDFRKDENKTTVSPRFESDDLMNMMKTGKGPEIIDKLDPIQAGNLEYLADIYSHLSPVQLNILASHRDAEKSSKCIELICREWSRQYDDIIRKLESNSLEKCNLLDIEYCANFCEQINAKLGFIINGRTTKNKRRYN